MNKPRSWTECGSWKLGKLLVLVCASVCLPALWLRSEARQTALARQSSLLRTSATSKEHLRRALLEPLQTRQEQQQQVPLTYQQQQQDASQTQLVEDWQAALQDAARDPPPEACQRLLWFTCLGGAASNSSDGRYVKFLKVAMRSAKQHAPSLVPVLIHGGEPGPVTQWFTEQGGTVVYHTLSFLPELQRVANESWSAKLVRMQGAFLRLDVPLVVEQIAREGLLDLANISTRYALYTDLDVMFVGGQGDINTCTAPLPSLVGFGPERWKGEAKNSGVLLFNVPAMAQELPRIVEYARERSWQPCQQGWDQGLLRFYLRDAQRPALVLPDEWNWKGYWGANPAAVIHHWHGPKPQQCLACLLQQRGQPRATYRAACRACPLAQLNLWSDVPDGGEYYVRMAVRFNSYLEHPGG